LLFTGKDRLGPGLKNGYVFEACIPYPQIPAFFGIVGRSEGKTEPDRILCSSGKEGRTIVFSEKIRIFGNVKKGSPGGCVTVYSEILYSLLAVGDRFSGHIGQKKTTQNYGCRTQEYE